MSELWSNAGLTTINALFRQACDLLVDLLRRCQAILHALHCLRKTRRLPRAI